MTTVYGSVEGFTEYHEARGRAVDVDWDVSVALLKASEWLDSAYDTLWFGYATGGYLQERKWPRTGAQTNTTPTYVFEDNVIPDAVLYATYEAAYREASSAGSLTVDYIPLKYKSARVEGAVSVDYIIPNDASDLQIQIPEVGKLMAPLVDPAASNSSGLSGRLIRG